MRFSAAFLVLIALLLSGCGGKSRVRDGGLFGPGAEQSGSASLPEGPTVNDPEVKAAEIYGPSVPLEGAVDPAPAAEPEPVVESAPPPKPTAKLCIALGAGTAFGFAHVGAMEILLRAKLPIHCIVGSEFGAVVGAIAALDLNVNTLQWQAFKIKEGEYFSFPLFTLKEPRTNGKKFNQFLAKVFGSRGFPQLRVAFASVATEPTSGRTIILRDGALTDALSASLALPGLFDSWKMRSGVLLQSGAMTAPMPVAAARELGGTFVVAINVMDDVRIQQDQRPLQKRLEAVLEPLRDMANSQKRGADFVIQPDLRAFSPADFNRQSEISAQGREAAEEALEKLQEQWKQHKEQLEQQ